MGRNFHSAKHYHWKGTEPGELLVCQDEEGNTLFAVYNEGVQSVSIEAYWDGYHKGKRAGRLELQRELRRLLDTPQRGE